MLTKSIRRNRDGGGGGGGGIFLFPLPFSVVVIVVRSFPAYKNNCLIPPGVFLTKPDDFGSRVS